MLALNEFRFAWVCVCIYMNIYTAYYIDKRILGNLENHLKYNKIV